MVSAVSHKRSDRGPWTVSAETSLSVCPIGIVRSAHTVRHLAPRQPGTAEPTPASIVLFPNHHYEAALEDLDGVEFLWVLSWFHRNDNWRPKVLPPRGPRIRRGVFSTRSPHRPNPIGLSLARLVSVHQRTLVVADLDLLDGTPVLDLKPYLAYTEAHPNARAGWLDPVLAADASGAAHRFTLTWTALATAQHTWLATTHSISLVAIIDTVLARDPTPHPYRRVERYGSALRLSVRSWRVHFTVTDTTVTITSIASGYPPDALSSHSDDQLEDGPAHRGFHSLWPTPSALSAETNSSIDPGATPLDANLRDSPET